MAGRDPQAQHFAMDVEARPEDGNGMSLAGHFPISQAATPKSADLNITNANLTQDSHVAKHVSASPKSSAPIAPASVPGAQFVRYDMPLKDQDSASGADAKPPGKGADVQNPTHVSSEWLCDVCRVATFSCFEEACTHEKECETNFRRLQSLNPQLTSQAYQEAARQQAYIVQQQQYVAAQAQQLAMYAAQQQQYAQAQFQYQQAQYAALQQQQRQLAAAQAQLGQPNMSSVLSPQPAIAPPAQPVPQAQQPAGNNRGGALVPARLRLALPEDVEYLNERECFLRSECVEMFSASEVDALAARNGRRNAIRVGQVGMRCVFCSSAARSAHDALGGNSKGGQQLAHRAVCYPSSIKFIRKALDNWRENHFKSCPSIPQAIKDKYASLGRVGSSDAERYRIEAAKKLGLVDGEEGGIWFK